jgi:hypothetical protein
MSEIGRLWYISDRTRTHLLLGVSGLYEKNIW